MDKIKVRDIPESGIDIEDSIDLECFEQSGQEFVRLIRPVRVHANIRRFDATVISEVRIDTRYESKCYRSLEDVTRDWSVRFELDYELEDKQEELDLEDDIRQEVILRLPTRVLSDAELAKGEPVEEVIDEDEEEDAPEGMYKPFSGLKDLEL